MAVLPTDPLNNMDGVAHSTRHNNAADKTAAAGSLSGTAFVTSESPPIQFVSPTGSDGFDGRWDRPKLTPQAGLDALSATGGVVQLAPGAEFPYSTTLVMGAGDVLQGGTANRWRGPALTKLRYSGTGSAVRIRSTAGVLDTVTLRGVVIDGNDATGAVDGLLIDVSGGTAVEGVLLEDCSILNFPRYNVSLLNLVFDIAFRRCAINNYSRVGIGGGTADDLVRVATDAAAGQYTFDDCYLAQYMAAKWCFFGAGTDLRFNGGTIAPLLNANGLRQAGGLTLVGTHVEGVSNTGVGIRVSGSQGRLIAPSTCETFATGVQVGDPDAPTGQTFGTTIMGSIGNNTTDVQIVAGGSRRGTLLLPFGNPATPITITNNRESTDGVYDEVIDLTLLTTNGVLDLRMATLRFLDATLRRNASVANQLDLTGKLAVSGETEIDGALNHDGTTVGLNGATPVTQGSAIAAADGTLADITTKFNSLLTYLRSRGDIAT